MKQKKRSGWRIAGRILLFVFGGLLALIIGLIIYLVAISGMEPPAVKDKETLKLQRTQIDSTCYTIGNNWFRKSNSGLYEMYVEGEPFERGVINGKLSGELIRSQEDVFVAQFSKIVPSKTYLHFLKYFIGWFNRNLPDHVAEEFKEEIYGESFSASPNYDYIGTNYARLMNYHAAHDIGHALQGMMLVGCTSFGTWNGQSADSSLIIGRNFDFYMGDDFAKDKMVVFYNPSKGYKFMFVTWGGFTGVVSGMNEKGLTVTINAAKTSVPSGAATPVSLVAREILQYAQNIEEAKKIAQRRKMFVSESFLVGSAMDNKAVIIEKTPEGMDIYDPGNDFITCTNHFQGPQLGALSSNIQQINESASSYRYERLRELLKEKGPNTVQKTVEILRDRGGLHNANIGEGNEKAINQLIAHHSIVFEPQKRLVWVSTGPWQLGEFVAYDLDKIFAMRGLQTDHEIYDSARIIPADTFLLTKEYRDFNEYRRLRDEMKEGKTIDPQALVAANPEYYHAYALAGDYCFRQKNYAAARKYYETALTKVIATKGEEEHIRKQLELCISKSAKR
ncbi:Acyl-coenzyme A:6-aminopenicillanic acid acyl-transferase [Chitinophaga terrae (ex Kim and Jung 2007)]|uniref:Acyl-coenzyme A:6-aminopenicillanic acid acyl-transferase n=1 Tax=Chitinophaga terrae (ex Kim and Jung 2007) TaxID=408074 RepID=A0A1H3ZW62_9BACT|nr:C45 family peptidase [Chitinophaga terrae (ex Kim and Jung 2007)]GEP93140.1 acyl-CoA--6-aminopenicillanic acid acyl-transferase [Chitinophaga terrae (ex Kim and Jung 2007)]SEA27957.1 Acyl-coenzyme A:6-aminopenicillanic acid acyl-transferase [Chitinophaga terrae (ex Kim and Jung 2007)]